MNVDQIEAYLAKKPRASQAAKQQIRNAVKKVDEVAGAKVDKKEADQWFNRAQGYAKKNPNNHFGIAIRYFEVAERFSGHQSFHRRAEVIFRCPATAHENAE